MCTYVWNRATRKGIIPEGFTVTHLLWTLVFLNLYCCETILSILCGCDEKTLRKWVWKGVDMLGNLDMASNSSSTIAICLSSELTFSDTSFASP